MMSLYRIDGLVLDFMVGNYWGFECFVGTAMDMFGSKIDEK